MAACDSPAAPVDPLAYDFTLDVGAGVVYRWPIGSTIRLYVTSAGDPERDALLAAAVDSAAADWEAGLDFGTIDFVRVDEPAEADVVVRWSDVPPAVRTDRCEPEVEGSAATTFCPTPDHARLEPFPPLDAAPDRDGGDGDARVRMIVTILAEEAVGTPRVRQLVAHELGHVLGIGGHSPDPDDLMWGGTLSTDRPSPADRATVRRLYRTAPSLVP